MVGDRLPAADLSLEQLRNWEAPPDVAEQERIDMELALRLTKQIESNPYGESMRNRRAISRQSGSESAPSVRLPRKCVYRGSYADTEEKSCQPRKGKLQKRW